MRLAIDVAQTCVQRAGCAWHANNLANELSQQIAAHDLHLYHDFGRWINATKTLGTRIPNVNEPFMNVSATESKTLWNAIENGEERLPGNPDLVISNSFMCPKINNAKLVYTVYDLSFWAHPNYSTELNRSVCQNQLLKSLKYADGYVFISEQSQKSFERYFPRWLERNNKPTAQIPPIRARPIHTCRPSSERFDDPESCWLHVGSIEPRKGIDELLNAYESYYPASAIKRPLRLIGGKGWMSEDIHKRIKEMSARLPVVYEGYLSEKERQYWLSRGFGLICSSHYEGYGLPIDEAADYELPVISTNVPSYRKFSERLSDFQNLSFSRSPEAMLELENDKERYLKISRITKDIARETAPDISTSKLISFYKSVLQNRL